MTPTHADKLAGALEAKLNEPTSREHHAFIRREHIARECREALELYRARPQLPEAGKLLVWSDQGAGIWQAIGIGRTYDLCEVSDGVSMLQLFTLSIRFTTCSSILSDSLYAFNDGKGVAQDDHTAILSAIEGREKGDVANLQRMLGRATMAYWAHAPVSKQDGDVSKGVFDEIEVYLNSLLPAPPTTGSEK